jgi:N-methylhydantoinase A
VKRIGVDVGGTFTDVVVLDERSGRTSWFKTLTDHAHPADGVMSAVRQAAVEPTEIASVKIGTTLALNAILTRSGARTGLITTRGFRDVLEIRRTHRDELFDLDETKPDPLVPRDLRIEVTERVAFDGTPVTPLDTDDVRRAWRELRHQGVESVAIVFLFSFENPDHERRAREIVLEEGGCEAVFISSDVLPAYREYERTSTTVAAAYVAPAVRNYLAELDSRLAADGVRSGHLSVMTNSGGSMSADAAAQAPIPTLLSGPAGGVTAMQWLAAHERLPNILTLDMGGTSTDVSGIVDGVADERLDMDIDRHAVSYPTYDLQTIGAGGGSIAWVDSGGSLRVGPQSAGSEPGPACYGLGGTLPTVTDANLVLGRYSPEVALGGSLTLDAERARRAIAEVADAIGLGIEAAAAGIVRIVNSHMVNAVRTISVERGRDARDFSLAAFGGAGPTHAVEVARELEIPTVLVPPFPGCASAFGAVIAKTRRDFVRTVARAVAGLDAAALGSLLGELRRQAVDSLRADGFDDWQVEITTGLSFRYRGQAYDLTVNHPGSEFGSGELERAVAEFHRTHRRLYGHSFADVPVELVNVRVTGLGRPEEPQMTWAFDASQRSGRSRDEAEMRPVRFGDGREPVMTTIVQRAELVAEDEVPGPAVILQSDSTIVLPPRVRAQVRPSGAIVIDVSDTERARAADKLAMAARI